MDDTADAVEDTTEAAIEETSETADMVADETSEAAETVVDETPETVYDVEAGAEDMADEDEVEMNNY
jgi:phosphoribosyl-ATP pyrophosphohydrolase